jgi:hypothetical protein
MAASKDEVEEISKYNIRKVPNFPEYFATECGRVISMQTGSPYFINGKIDKDGYRNLTLYREGKPYYFKNSRIIALTYLGERPRGSVIRHKDGNPLNDAKTNLEYCTQQENISDKKKHGTELLGERHFGSKLTEKQVREILKLVGTKKTKELAEMFGVSPSCVCDIKAGRTWGHLRGDL